jgi:hypothetical protein
MREREWPQQNGVHHAESGDVGANPQCKSQHSDKCERGTLNQHPESVSNILEKGIHVISFAHNLGTSFES